MSHLANHLNQPDEAIQLSRQGQAVLRSGAPSPELEARLLALEARGVAAAEGSDPAEVTTLLTRAERALQVSPAEPLSPWISRFDEGSLAGETVRCMRHLGDLAEAQRQAQRVITLRPSQRTRSRAFGQLALAAVLVAQGKADEACGLAKDVLDSTHALGSFLVIGELMSLARLLHPHRSSPSSAEFRRSLDEALTRRLHFYQWLRKDEQACQPALREDP